MESSRVFLLLIGICSVILVREAHAECCRSLQTIKFRIKNGRCDTVGGKSGLFFSDCHVKICADGKAPTGTYCGWGKCNIFGCACNGGCRTGGWSDSFSEKYQQHGITILEKWF
ncbi:hypothetical protein KR054_009346 [Drosophila jambulina]|nr:hypothetical protein KR054_009346 [Drosophila jambulina]